MKLHTRMKMKYVGKGIGNLPALGQSGRNIQVVAAREQVVKNQAVNPLGLRVYPHPWIKIGRARLNDHHQRVGVGSGRARKQHKNREPAERNQNDSWCQCPWALGPPTAHSVIKRPWSAEQGRWLTHRKSFLESRSASRPSQKAHWKSAGAMFHKPSPQTRPPPWLQRAVLSRRKIVIESQAVPGIRPTCQPASRFWLRPRRESSPESSCF